MFALGKKVWVLPDCERPPEGEGALIGHESIIIFNGGKEDAKISISLYFESLVPIEDISVIVAAQRVRVLRTYDPEHFSGIRIPYDVTYAMKLESTVPIVVQYGRLDVRQPNMAFYTTMGYSEE